MRTPALLATLLVLASPLAAQAKPDPDKAVAGGGSLPAGWSARLDLPEAGMANVKFGPMGGGLHVTTGPAVILWRDADVVPTAHIFATFIQTKAPAHPEAYGLFVGGKDLKGDGQAYLYFIIRGDGKFLIKKRAGTVTTNVTPAGWTDSDALVKQDAAGTATNKLEIDGKMTPGKMFFRINGKVVYEMPADASQNGIAGLRINHNLDVHIDGFGIHK